MRCGCTNPCPACPGAHFYEDLNAAIALSVPVAAVTQVLISETINIPAALPGTGAILVADFVACTGDDQNDIQLIWTLAVDGVVIQRRPAFGSSAFIKSSDDCESYAITGAVNNLTPGDRTFTLNLIAASTAGTGVLDIMGAGMRITLVRADQLTVDD